MNLFSENLKRERIARGFSFRSLSRASGISVGTLERWEQGKGIPSTYKMWEALGQAMQIEPSAFLADPRQKNLEERVRSLEAELQKLSSLLCRNRTASDSPERK